MNRSRFVDRIYLASDDGGNRRVSAMAATGTERSVGHAAVLASIVPEEILTALISHFACLNEFGGQVYIGTARVKVDVHGSVVEHNEPGEYQTLGYVVNYNHRSQVKGQVQESDAPLQDAELPELSADELDQHFPDSEPEPVEA